MDQDQPIDQLKSSLGKVQAYWDGKAQEETTDRGRVDSSPRTQRMRFEAFLSTHDLSNSSVLDVGCGLGDFWEHLQKHRGACKYHGVDLSPKMIERARAKFPQASFSCLNILETDIEPYDYVVSFGIHCLRVEGGWEIVRSVTQRQFELCRKAAHVGLLTDRFQGFGPLVQCWRAEEVLAFAFTLTPYVMLRHDYLPNDFSITLYRELLIDTARFDLPPR